jgi:hypothetical protein
MPDRLAAIRARCKGAVAVSYQPSGLFRGEHPDVPSAVLQRKGLPARDFITDRQNGHYQRCLWIAEPADLNKRNPENLKVVRKTKRKPLVEPKSRVKRISPLTRIALKWQKRETFEPGGA